MQPDTTVIPYSARHLYRNAWARRQRRFAVNLAAGALLAPAVVYPLGAILALVLPSDGDLLAVPAGLVFGAMALAFGGTVAAVIFGVAVAPPLNRRDGTIRALLNSAAAVIQQSPITLFHRAWSRWRVRCAALLLVMSAVVPFTVGYLTHIVGEILPTRGELVDIPLQVLSGYLGAFICATAGLAAAFTALVIAEDRRLGTLPRYLAQAAIIIDGIMLLVLLCMLSFLVWQRL